MLGNMIASGRGTLSHMTAALRQLVAVAAIAVLTVLSYLAWLDWDQKKDRIPGTSSFEGPYEAWQVIGLALTLAALAVVASLRRAAVVAGVVIPVVLTIAWSVDAANAKSFGANLWPIGAAFLAAGSVAGIALVCALSVFVRERRSAA